MVLKALRYLTQGLRDGAQGSRVSGFTVLGLGAGV